MNQGLNKRKVNKRAELIETVTEIWNDIDQEIMRNCVNSMTERRIIQWDGNKVYKTGF